MDEQVEITLSHIDDALSGADVDWAVSDDAMRWAPEEIPTRPIDRLWGFIVEEERGTTSNPTQVAVLSGYAALEFDVELTAAQTWQWTRFFEDYPNFTRMAAAHNDRSEP